MLQAIEETEGFFAGQPLDFTRYQQDVRTRRATERNLEIMGEAVGRLLKFNPAFQLPNARQVVATRNRIIHGYDAVSDEMVWSIVVRHRPQLKKEVAALLAGEWLRGKPAKRLVG